MNKKYEPVIDFASFQKWRDDFNRGIQDVVDAESREQMGKNVGAVLTRSLDAIFEQAAAGSSSTKHNTTPDTDGYSESASWSPRANCAETKTAYVVEVELAGVSMDEVNVEVAGRNLIVSGEVSENLTVDGLLSVDRPSSFDKKERHSGDFERVFELPADFDIDAVDATMENGLLTVRVAKQDAVRRRVKVELKPG